MNTVEDRIKTAYSNHGIASDAYTISGPYGDADKVYVIRSVMVRDADKKALQSLVVQTNGGLTCDVSARSFAREFSSAEMVAA